MTIGSENLGNGAVKPERMGGKYRGARRDAVLTEDAPGGGERDARDDGGPVLKSVESSRLPSLDLAGLTEPVFQPPEWPIEPRESLVEHPLLRGLLLELPPRGTGPAPEWLDRWFEATRAILELLYVQGPDGRR
jgi:hypothetical protein